MSPVPPGRVLAISPHLDDAVLGCAGLLSERPGAIVLTLFAGTGHDPSRKTGWDADCGFSSAGQAMAERWREDDHALALLDAIPHRLPYADHQYRDRDGEVAVDDLAGAIAWILQLYRPDVVAIPLGLFHRDHELAHEAALQAWEQARAWIAYEDALYRGIDGAIERRLAALARAGFAVSPLDPCPCTPVKIQAVHCYGSQLRGLGTPGRPGIADALAPERYWRIEPGTPA